MDHDFPKLIASTSNPRLRIRLLAASHLTEGLSRTQIAKYLKVSRVSVNKWVKAYLTHGIIGLKRKVSLWYIVVTIPISPNPSFIPSNTPLGFTIEPP